MYPTQSLGTPTIMVEKLEQNFFIRLIVALMNPAWAVPNFHCIVCAVGDHSQHRHIREYEAKASHRSHADDLKYPRHIPGAPGARWTGAGSQTYR